MADQDFKINVITTADTSGIDRTTVAMKRLTDEQRVFQSIANRTGETLQQVEARFKSVASAPLPPLPSGGEPSDTTGLTKSAIGIGTIISLLTAATNKWREFNAEQDRWVDGMIKAEEKARALGESILDMQDKARDAARVETEPLEQSYIRLQQEVIRLKTELSELNLPEEGEEYKKLAHDLSIVESQLNHVTSALQRQKDEADKATRTELEKRVPGLKAPEIKEADAQTQHILMNEQAAASARAEGREKDAEMFEKSAEQYKASATPQQLADLQRIHELQDKLKPPEQPTYKPLTPEEFQRQSEAAEAALKEGGPGKIGAEAEAARRAEIEETRKATIKAEQDRQEELKKKGVVPAELERQQSKDASIANKLDAILAHQKAVWGY